MARSNFQGIHSGRIGMFLTRNDTQHETEIWFCQHFRWSISRYHTASGCNTIRNIRYSRINNTGNHHHHNDNTPWSQDHRVRTRCFWFNALLLRQASIFMFLSFKSAYTRELESDTISAINRPPDTATGCQPDLRWRHVGKISTYPRSQNYV